MAENLKIKDGHWIQFKQSETPRGSAVPRIWVFVTDDSGEKVEVDTTRPIVAARGTFVIPVVGGFETMGPAEEAFVIAQKTGMRILAGGRRFEVRRIP